MRTSAEKSRTERQTLAARDVALHREGDLAGLEGVEAQVRRARLGVVAHFADGERRAVARQDVARGGRRRGVHVMVEKDADLA
jgi:hypothetical protein